MQTFRLLWLEKFPTHWDLFSFSRSNLSLLCFGLLMLFQTKVEGHHQQVVVTSNVCRQKTSCSGSELYNHEANTDRSVLNCSKTDTVDDLPSLRKGPEAAVQSLKKGKSAGVDIIPGELVHSGRGDVITALTAICDKIWQTGEWPTPWTQSLVITLPKKGNLEQCQN